ncbi:MAG: hypothetical protein JNK72_01040 [Myxococcales bacterium]|nr:hypothetical protein [Myxococcales bacterium]
MRKLFSMGLVSFAVAAVAASGISQPRRNPRRPVAQAPAAPPPSPRIAQELGQLRWGMNHAQVVAYYRGLISASYAPRLRNVGMLEQNRIIDQRENEIRTLERTWVEFDGALAHRQWDSSFIGEEYTHGNGEAMLMYEDARHNREFFFFINDRLWKRVQARNTAGAQIDFDDFASQLEAIFGPGQREQAGQRLTTVRWFDDTTRLHVVDNTTFFSAFCLIYQERQTQDQLAQLRRNTLPTKQQRRVAGAVEAGANANAAGVTTGDSNADIVDRITGKMRRVQNAEAGAAASAQTGAAAGPPGRSGRDAGVVAPPPPAPADNDPLGGLGF